MEEVTISMGDERAAKEGVDDFVTRKGGGKSGLFSACLPSP
jgi:hypothetical protein